MCIGWPGVICTGGGCVGAAPGVGVATGRGVTAVAAPDSGRCSGASVPPLILEELSGVAAPMLGPTLGARLPP